MRTWANLHNHTIYSRLDGLSKPKTYAEACARMGMTHATITDHGNIYGWIAFYDACIEAGVIPILGSEFYQARKQRFDRDDEERSSGKADDDLEQRGPHHLTVLAQNLTGYHNIIKLSSRAFLEGFYVKPRVDFDLLSQHSEGVIVLSGCLNGVVQQALLRDDYQAALAAAGKYRDIYGENFYIEIQDHGLEEQKRVKQETLQIAKTIGAKVVPTGDCHYTSEADHDNHDTMLCVSTASNKADEKRFRFAGPHFYLKSYDEMSKLFLPEWLQNSVELANTTELTLERDKFHFPEFPLPDGVTAGEHLKALARDGLKRLYGDPLPPEVRERALYELGVIGRMGFESYFLIVADIVGWAKSQGIRVGHGRGSAAGSIISYGLGITGLDPLKRKLIFERFLMEGRKTMPDIDLDFDERYRDRVIEYTRQRYGDDRVTHICTFTTVKARTAIKDATRVLGYDFQTGDRIAKMIPPAVQGVERTMDESLELSRELAEEYGTPDGKRIIDAAKGLEGIVRQPGIHPAGILITPSETVNYAPVMRQSDEDPLVTQWDGKSVEAMNLLKIDFLGLRNLSVIDMCLENVQKTKGLIFDVDDIPLDDALTYAQLQKGYTMGCFQIEESGIQSLVLSMQPSSWDDMAALVALYRPGPMGSNMHNMYVERKHGRQRVSSWHPAVDDIMSDTYGVAVYQEQVIQAVQRLAGFSVSEADDMRRVIGKKQKDKVDSFEGAFVKGCKKTNNIPESQARKIYADIKYFAGYGFAKAHADAYGLLAYYTAYLKFNHPTEYMAALLSSVSDKMDKAARYLTECRRMGIKVQPPSVNHSSGDFNILDENTILFGFQSIKGIGPRVSRAIINSRSANEFNSMYDFLRRCDPDVLNVDVIKKLAVAGTFDELIQSENAFINRRDKSAILALEKQQLGLYVTDHPLSGVWHELEPRVTHEIETLELAEEGQTVTVAGMISEVDKKTTKRGDTMYIVQLADLTGQVEVVIFPKIARQWTEGVDGPFIMTGKLAREGDDENFVSKIHLNSFEIVELPDYDGDPIRLTFNQPPAYSMIEAMKKLIKAHPGDRPVFLDFVDGDVMASVRIATPAASSIEESFRQLRMMQVDEPV